MPALLTSWPKTLISHRHGQWHRRWATKSDDGPPQCGIQGATTIPLTTTFPRTVTISEWPSGAVAPMGDPWAQSEWAMPGPSCATAAQLAFLCDPDYCRYSCLEHLPSHDHVTPIAALRVMDADGTPLCAVSAALHCLHQRASPLISECCPTWVGVLIQEKFHGAAVFLRPIYPCKCKSISAMHSMSVLPNTLANATSRRSARRPSSSKFHGNSWCNFAWAVM